MGASALELQPALALVDVRMPGGGPAAARGICEASPATRIVALSSNDDAESVRLMLAAGATSYLVKGTPPDELLGELRAAVAPPSRPHLRVISGPARRVLVAVTDPAALDRLADAIQSAPGLELGLAQTSFHAVSLRRLRRRLHQPASRRPDRPGLPQARTWSSAVTCASPPAPP